MVMGELHSINTLLRADINQRISNFAINARRGCLNACHSIHAKTLASGADEAGGVF